LFGSQIALPLPVESGGLYWFVTSKNLENRAGGFKSGCGAPCRGLAHPVDPAGVQLEGGDASAEVPPGVVNITPKVGDVVVISELLTHGALTWQPKDRERRDVTSLLAISLQRCPVSYWILY